MHGAMRCFDKVSDLVKEDKQQLPRQWGERRAFQEETACAEDLHRRGA